MVRKAVTTLVLAGSVALGAAGTASAQPGPRCANAPDRIARLQAEETHLAAQVATLEGRMARQHHLWWLRREVSALTHEETRVSAQIQHLQAACSGTDDPTTTSTSTTTSTTAASGGGTTTVGSTFAD